MFLSIIIPVYNCDKYLEDCLKSCLKQDVPVDDYEILCINDGSTDNSADILAKYSKKYNKVKVYTQENKGVSAARNVGLDHSRGEYIMFVDGDDLIRNDVLGDLIDILQETNTSRLFIGAFRADSKIIDSMDGCVPKPNYSYDNLLWCNLFQRDLIEKHHLRFNEDLTHSEDIMFVNDYKSFYDDFDSFPETVYYYRQHTHSAMNDKNSETLLKMLISYVKIVDICKNRMSDKVFRKDLNYLFWNKHMIKLMYFIPELTMGDRKLILNLMKSSGPFLRIDKTHKIDRSLKKSIQRSNALRRIEIAVYANALGAHLIVLRRKISDSRFGKIIKHPKRFMRTARIKTNIINHRK